MPHYIHDMLHCNMPECSRHEQCYRYWLGQHLKGSGFRYASFYWPQNPEQINENCELFIDIKNYET